MVVNVTSHGLMDPLQTFGRKPDFFRLGRLDRRRRKGNAMTVKRTVERMLPSNNLCDWNCIVLAGQHTKRGVH